MPLQVLQISPLPCPPFMSFSFCLYYKYLCHFSQSDYVMLCHFLQKLSYNRNTADIVYRLNFSNSSQPVCFLSNHVKSIFFLLPVHILRSVLSQHPHISQISLNTSVLLPCPLNTSISAKRTSPDL